MALSKPLDASNRLPFELPVPPSVSSAGLGWQRLTLIQCCEPTYEIPLHQSPLHVICINMGKTVELTQKVADQTAVIQSVETEVGIYPAFIEQSFAWHGEAEFLQLLLEPSHLLQLNQELHDLTHVELIPQLTTLFDPLIYQVALSLRHAIATEMPGSQLYADTMATALTAHLLTHYTRQKFKPQRAIGKLTPKQIEHVREYVLHHLAQDLRLSDLAAVAGLSEYHFARLFKQATRISPHQFHLQCRVEQAKILLRDPEFAIAEVAQSVGFASQAHLNRHFKRWVGVTPHQFRQQ
jgi:AraC family transcriptional regulator